MHAIGHLEVDEVRCKPTAVLLADANRKVDEYVTGRQSDKVEIEEIAQMLEALPLDEYVDDRAELAWRIIVGALVLSDDALLGRRLLYAAFPPKSKIRDKDIYRRWLLALGVCEFHASNAEAALKSLSASLEVARELGHRRGEAAVLGNLTLFAAAAGRYEDVLVIDEHATSVLEGQSAWPEHLRASGLNRGNALHRVGRLEDSLAAYSSSMLFLPARPNVRERAAYFETLLQVSEIFIHQGRTFHARSVLANLRAHLEAVSCEHRTRHRCAALTALADGDLRTGISLLEAELTREPEVCERISGDNWASDVLHTLQWAYREIGEVDAAEGALRRIGDRMLRSALVTVDALRNAPSILEHLGAEAKLREIDQYLIAKRVLPSTANMVELGRTWDYLISVSASATSAEDSTLEHGLRVGALARRLAQIAGESQSSAQAIERAALIHDIGKVGVPRSVLAKTDILSEHEQDLLDAHSKVGAGLLERADFDGKRVAVNVALFHHAPFDGLGGKSSPAGAKIPVAARIVAICDAFDGLIMGRPRRQAISAQSALKELFQRGGRDFDPWLTELFVEMIRELLREHSDLISLLSEGSERIHYFAAQRMLRRSSAGMAPSRMLPPLEKVARHCN
jgi:HD-GYP domain-containing protein (c-di-GMP phosphodiesterase class II)